MFNVCYQCGQYRADKIIDPSGPAAICPECGHRHPFRKLPLLVVGGASRNRKEQRSAKAGRQAHPGRAVERGRAVAARI